jgi:hypothetical protein
LISIGLEDILSETSQQDGCANDDEAERVAQKFPLLLDGA